MRYLKGEENTSDENPKNEGNVPKLLIELNYGGKLTESAKKQAAALGKLFKTIYPKNEIGLYEREGRGVAGRFLPFNEDLEIYASDEGRVQRTAGFFGKGLFDLGDGLSPFGFQKVNVTNTNVFLHDIPAPAQAYKGEMKKFLNNALQVDRDFTTQDIHELNQSNLRIISKALNFIKNPNKMCHEIAGYLEKMCEIVDDQMKTNPGILFQNESIGLIGDRWNTLLAEFRKISENGEVKFDLEKIIEIYDNIKYDFQQNPELFLMEMKDAKRFHLCVKNMANVLIAQEYGIGETQKMMIAQGICTPLLNEIRENLIKCLKNPHAQTTVESTSSKKPVMTRWYFTSESHFQTLMNLLKFGQLCKGDDMQWKKALKYLSSVSEFDDFSQLIFSVYENTHLPITDSQRFQVELMFSPGTVLCLPEGDEENIAYVIQEASRSLPDLVSEAEAAVSSSTKTVGSEFESMKSDLTEEGPSTPKLGKGKWMNRVLKQVKTGLKKRLGKEKKVKVLPEELEKEGEDIEEAPPAAKDDGAPTTGIGSPSVSTDTSRTAEAFIEDISPPIRALRTLHDSIPLERLDFFLSRMIENRLEPFVKSYSAEI